MINNMKKINLNKNEKKLNNIKVKFLIKRKVKEKS